MNVIRVAGAAVLLSLSASLFAAPSKISAEQARASALAKVPDGKVKTEELEKEHGRLIWSFDIAKPSTPGITEVHVDAKTGKVISVKRETPGEEKKESQEERH